MDQSLGHQTIYLKCTLEGKRDKGGSKEKGGSREAGREGLRGGKRMNLIGSFYLAENCRVYPASQSLDSHQPWPNRTPENKQLKRGRRRQRRNKKKSKEE